MAEYDLSAKLSRLSIEELRDILNNEEKFEAVSRERLEKINQDRTPEKDMIVASTNSLNEYIIATMEQFQVTKLELMDSYDNLKLISERVASKLEQIKGQNNTVDANVMLVQLQSAVTQLEEETENLAEKFLRAEIAIELFVEEYISKRKLLYIRKMKLEKINEINDRRSSYKSPIRPAPAPPTSVMSSTGGLYPAAPNFSSALPYPLGLSHMPMPSYNRY